jgi:tetratricopeptide (TPR) repeat protein
MGAPRARALCYNFGGALDFQAGHWEQAEKNLRDAVTLYGEVGSASGESLSLQRLGVLLTALGRLDESRQLLADGIAVAQGAAMRSHCLTRLHASMIRNRLAANDRDGTETSLAEGLEAARRHGNCVTCNALLLPEVVRAEIELGQLDAAREHLESLQSTAGDFDSQVWTAMAAQAEGRVLLAEGDHGAALDAFARAKNGYEAVDQPYEVARCLASMGACDPAQKAALSERAATILASLGAPGVE